MKKKILLTTFLTTALYTLIYAFDCYDTWVAAVDAAILTHQSDLDRCDDAIFIIEQKCIDEANISYNTALDTAADTYICCVNRC